MKGTNYKDLMWAYADEATFRKRKYIKNCKDYNRKFFKNYRSEKVLKRLLQLELKRIIGGI